MLREAMSLWIVVGLLLALITSLKMGILYQYTGSGFNWSWNDLGEINAIKTASGVELEVAQSQLLGLASTINIGFASLNSSWTEVGQIPLTNSGAAYSLTSTIDCGECGNDNLILGGNINSTPNLRDQWYY